MHSNHFNIAQRHSETALVARHVQREGQFAAQLTVVVARRTSYLHSTQHNTYTTHHTQHALEPFQYLTAALPDRPGCTPRAAVASLCCPADCSRCAADPLSTQHTTQHIHNTPYAACTRTISISHSGTPRPPWLHATCSGRVSLLPS